MKIEDEELLSEARSILNTKANIARLTDVELVCECECVSAGDIREYLKGKNKYLNLDDLRSELKLGSGCSTCTKNFEVWKMRI
jgi:NAD(P)H-nitrite reductase large subunit